MRQFTKKLRKNETGSTLIEVALLLPIMLGMTLGICEFGYIFFQNATAQKATQLGARLASTRGLVDITNVTDCFHDDSNIDNVPSAGTDCSSALVTVSQPNIVCSSSSTTNCDTTVFSSIVGRMTAVYPNITASNVVITFAPSGIGYIGRQKPVPAITVSVQNLQYNYIAIGGLYDALHRIVNGTPKSFASVVNLDTAQTTIIAEDIE